MTEHVAISRYTLSPELAIEDFGDEALLFLPEGDLIINVNKSAALIMEQCKNTFDEQPFSMDQVIELLQKLYDLTDREARSEGRALLSFALRHKIARPHRATAS